MTRTPDLKVFPATPNGAGADKAERTIGIDFVLENGDHYVMVVPQSLVDSLILHIERARDQLPPPFGSLSTDRD